MLRLFILLSFVTCSQQQINQAINEASKLSQKPLTKEEMGLGLKQALIKGLNKSVSTLSKSDGFLGNKEVRIPFPKEARTIKETLTKLGMSSIINQTEVSLNRAAEDAATAAKPIFLSAISKLSFTDVLKIVQGNGEEATNYLRSTTQSQLIKAFRPKIASSLKKVDATKYWSDVMQKYNQIPFVPRVNPDLNLYVTKLAVNGLFLEISKEELNIRKNPRARTTELLKRVFSIK